MSDVPPSSTASKPTTFRVYPAGSDDWWRLLDVDTGETTDVPWSAFADLDLDLDLQAGSLVDAALSSYGSEVVVETATLLSATRFRFERTSAPVFEAARECFRDARAAGDAMNSRVTYDTDGQPNGVVYTFADAPGGDRFAEFRDARRPLEPLLDRAAGSDVADPPFSVWVLDADEPFVLVYVVLDPDGLLERTMRTTYLGTD